MDQVQDNQSIAIAFPEDAIEGWAIVYVDVTEKLIDNNTHSKSPTLDSKGDSPCPSTSPATQI